MACVDGRPVRKAEKDLADRAQQRPAVLPDRALDVADERESSSPGPARPYSSSKSNRPPAAPQVTMGTPASFAAAKSGCARAQFHTVFSVGMDASARQIARRRRTQSLRQNWRLFREHGSGVASSSATFDGGTAVQGQEIDTFLLAPGVHTIEVTATADVRVVILRLSAVSLNAKRRS